MDRHARRHPSKPRFPRLSLRFIVFTLLFALAVSITLAATPANFQIFLDPTGSFETLTTNPSFDNTNPFFQQLGTNGRTCGTCHVASDAWTVDPAHLVARFNATQGLDPIFRTVDGSNSPNADVSTIQARRKAYSMLLNKGVIRVGIGIPAGAEFTLVAVDDPYGFASAAQLSLFRRPLPATNLPFLSAVMWDGRETTAGQTIYNDLIQQALDATMGHAQATTQPSAATLQAIVQFEIATFTAQIRDNNAGGLTVAGAQGGPQFLSIQPFTIGMNDPLGSSFNPLVFTDFAAWGNNSLAARASIARGEAIFNTRQFQITGVGGLNDALNQPSITGTCSFCHNTPNVGDHSSALPLNIGIADASRRTPDMPLYTLRNNATGATIQTTDPGRALITGKWSDIGKFKGPVLRGLAARAPYFHNGSAATLLDVVKFYNTRFNIGLTSQEQTDLANFLAAQ